MSILKYNEEELKKLVKDGLCPYTVVNALKICQALKDGKSISDVAADFNISYRRVQQIRDQHMK